MGLKHRFGNSVMWSAAGHWSREIINFGVFLALARLLGPKSYGIMGMAAIAVAMANAFLVDGISLFIVRAPKLDPGHLNGIFWIQLILAALLGFSIAALGPAFSIFYGQPELTPIMSTMAVLPLFFGLSSVPDALLRRAMNFRTLTFLSAVAAAVGGTFGISLALAGYGVWSLVFMYISQWITQCACLWRITDWRPGLRLQTGHVQDLISFGMNTISVNLLSVLNVQLPRFVVASSLGAVSLGFFTMAWRIFEVTSLLTLLPISQVMVPTLAALQSDATRLRAGLASIVQFPFIISVPCFTGLFVIAPVLVPVIFGGNWVGAVVLIQLFSISGLPWALWSALDATVVASGMMAWRASVALVSMVILGASVALTYRWGLAAIAATIVARDTILCAGYATALHYRGFLRCRELVRAVAPFAASALTMAVLVLLWRWAAAPLLSGIAMLLSAVVVGVGVYCAALALFARGLTNELLNAALAVARRKS
jgi:O-antigen/teichoic acid export membrane protein